MSLLKGFHFSMYKKIQFYLILVQDEFIILVTSKTTSENILQASSEETFVEHKEIVHLNKALNGSPLDPNDFKIPDVKERPWYMKVQRHKNSSKKTLSDILIQMFF